MNTRDKLMASRVLGEMEKIAMPLGPMLKRYKYLMSGTSVPALVRLMREGKGLSELTVKGEPSKNYLAKTLATQLGTAGASILGLNKILSRSEPQPPQD